MNSGGLCKILAAREPVHFRGGGCFVQFVSSARIPLRLASQITDCALVSIDQLPAILPAGHGGLDLPELGK